MYTCRVVLWFTLVAYTPVARVRFLVYPPLFFHRHILFQVIIIIHFIFYIKNIIISIMSCMINEDNGNIE